MRYNDRLDFHVLLVVSVCQFQVAIARFILYTWLQNFATCPRSFQQGVAQKKNSKETEMCKNWTRTKLKGIWNGWRIFHLLHGVIIIFCPHSGELRVQKSKSHLHTQSFKILPITPGVGQYIAIHTMLTVRDFFLANFYPSGPFTSIFPKPFPSFSSFSCG